LHSTQQLFIIGEGLIGLENDVSKTEVANKMLSTFSIKAHHSLSCVIAILALGNWRNNQNRSETA
jgi:hypothetical protein